MRLNVEYERPNPYLYNFSGTIGARGTEQKVALDQSNMILRGCSLRNTDFIFGLILYTGPDTKIMLNSVKAKPKKSKLEKFMNSQIMNICLL